MDRTVSCPWRIQGWRIAAAAALFFITATGLAQTNQEPRTGQYLQLIVPRDDFDGEQMATTPLVALRPIVVFGWQDFSSGNLGSLTKPGVRTTIGLGGYLGGAQSNIFYEMGLLYIGANGDDSKQINQPGATGFEGTVDSLNIFAGSIGCGIEFGNDGLPFESNREDSLLSSLRPNVQIGGRLNVGGADANLKMMPFDPAKPQFIINSPKESAAVVGGEVFGRIGWEGRRGSIGVEGGWGVTGTDAITGTWDTSGGGYAGLFGVLFFDRLYGGEPVTTRQVLRGGRTLF